MTAVGDAQRLVNGDLWPVTNTTRSNTVHGS
ncbi:rCG53687 [Rattus norvegicus]|uniref:RCG53687 n=1 Tax=Rattus norvegicus TaxID=10116 RepID=A6J942_RAT|nr:rCG53687 [Rattus norvegicus]